MCTGETVDQSNCVQLPRDIMCLPIGSMLLRSKILWMKHVVFWREPDGVIPRATGDWLTGRWDSRKVLRHCHNTWKTSTYARRCWSSRFWHSDWKSGLFADFYRKYSKVRTFPGPGGQQLKIRTFPGNKDPWEPWFTHSFGIYQAPSNFPNKFHIIFNPNHLFLIHLLYEAMVSVIIR